MKAQPSQPNPDSSSQIPGLPDVTRRGFLGGVGGAAALASSLGAAAAVPNLLASTSSAAEIGPLNGRERKRAALNVRKNAAEAQANKPLVPHPDNGDEALYADLRGSYGKALPHDSVLGEVTPASYAIYKNALTTGSPADLDLIPLGAGRKLACPQAGLAFEMTGPDSHHLAIPAAPAFASDWAAAEMVELYWRALTRDIKFRDYATNPTIAEACADLTALGSSYKGPKIAGQVTPATIFRHSLELDLVGPFISQFALKPIVTGSIFVDQKYKVAVPADDFGTTFVKWLEIIRGKPQLQDNHLDPVGRYLRNGRDQAEVLHQDFTYQNFLYAALILIEYQDAALSSTNPYLSNPSQGGFVTFGNAHILDMVARAANLGLKAAWYQKWFVHRRTRPEEFGGRVHLQKTGVKDYGINAKVLNSLAVQRTFEKFGTYFLPLAYPEGSPTHPAYPAGHATISGACVTILKAFFDENFVLPSPVIASADGLSLEPFVGPALTVGGELNKLASNISLGRDTAGVHYRTDGVEGILLGEQVAIGLLEDYAATYNESFAGFQFTKFDGTQVII